jgi:hypothetical protein
MHIVQHNSACFFDANYINKLLFVTLLPIAIIFVLIIGHVLRVKTTKRNMTPAQRQSSWDGSFQASLLALFMFYVVTSTTVSEQVLH